MVEIYRLLHIDSDCYHMEQNGCIKGYHKYQFFLSSKIRQQKPTNSKSRVYILDYYWLPLRRHFCFYHQIFD